MIRRLPTVALLIASCLFAQNSREIILAARRTPVVEVIDAATLDTVARLHFNSPIERLRMSADGGVIFVEALEPGCCKTYALDFSSMQITALKAPRYPTNSLPSPDGQWRYDLKNFRGVTVTAVNLVTHQSVEMSPAGLPPDNPDGNWAGTGVWSEDHFYFYVDGPGDPGYLWTVQPGARTLGSGIRVDAFNEAPGCRQYLPVSKSLVAAAGNIFIYEPFGGKSDRTVVCKTQLLGGAWRLDPATGHLSAYIAPEFHFNTLLANRSGSILYGVDPGSANWSGPVQLVSVDSRDGTILKTRSFDPGVLQIGVGQLREVPAGDVYLMLPPAGQ